MCFSLSVAARTSTLDRRSSAGTPGVSAKHWTIGVLQRPSDLADIAAAFVLIGGDGHVETLLGAVDEARLESLFTELATG